MTLGFLHKVLCEQVSGLPCIQDKKIKPSWRGPRDSPEPRPQGKSRRFLRPRYNGGVRGGDLLLARLHIRRVKQLMVSCLSPHVTFCDLLGCVPPICRSVQTFDNTMRQLALRHKSATSIGSSMATHKLRRE